MLLKVNNIIVTELFKTVTKNQSNYQLLKRYRPTIGASWNGDNESEKWYKYVCISSKLSTKYSHMFYVGLPDAPHFGAPVFQPHLAPLRRKPSRR